MQIKQAQVKEVLKYNVRAVSRLFSSHKAYGHMAAGHDSLTMHSWSRELEQVMMTHFYSLADLDALQPLDNVPSLG